MLKRGKQGLQITEIEAKYWITQHSILPSEYLMYRGLTQISKRWQGQPCNLQRELVNHIEQMKMKLEISGMNKYIIHNLIITFYLCSWFDYKTNAFLISDNLYIFFPSFLFLSSLSFSVFLTLSLSLSYYLYLSVWISLSIYQSYYYIYLYYLFISLHISVFFNLCGWTHFFLKLGCTFTEPTNNKRSSFTTKTRSFVILPSVTITIWLNIEVL